MKMLDHVVTKEERQSLAKLSEYSNLDAYNPAAISEIATEIELRAVDWLLNQEGTTKTRKNCSPKIYGIANRLIKLKTKNPDLFGRTNNVGLLGFFR